LEEAGAFCLALECIPEDVAATITSALSIPTIGIGAGVHCDGQVLVLHDLLGITGRVHPRFVKQYAQVGDTIRQAVEQFARDVREERFPAAEHSFESSPAGAPAVYTTPRK
jgi:3-methyl-2-oxobutanoate hydroxymethyltransferase